MPRTIIQAPCKDLQRANQIAQNILTANKYQRITENGEQVWKCGKGFWTAAKYIKVEFSGSNSAVLSGWIHPWDGEQDLSGIVGAPLKRQVMKVLQEIQNAIR